MMQRSCASCAFLEGFATTEDAHSNDRTSLVTNPVGYSLSSFVDDRILEMKKILGDETVERLATYLFSASRLSNLIGVDEFLSGHNGRFLPEI